ncbi:hypothetical protein [Caldimonas tepidiphila]|uniref:hypothetical protein n=1 Tax=Caldimonas tepidiphila TaxID=2315841 RepID=UPI000E5BF047|nr:hypothetical protein [Caldimonas tepidiphila]
MTTSPQTLRPTLAATPITPMDELLRETMEACEHAHDACLQAVREALSSKRSAPPLNDWLAGASLCRTLAEVLAVEAPEADQGAGARRQRLSRWATGMAQLCAGVCSELASLHEDDRQEDESSRGLRQACEGCVQACVRLLADAGPPGGGLTGDAGFMVPRTPVVTPLMRRLRPGTLPPQTPSLAAA